MRFIGKKYIFLASFCREQVFFYKNEIWIFEQF
jgi:hypothetical protein